MSVLHIAELPAIIPPQKDRRPVCRAHANPVALTQEICGAYGYQSWIVTKEGAFVEAVPVMQSLGTNTTWGSSILNRNVLFLSRNMR